MTRRPRGTVLLLALFFMLVATFLAHAFLVIVPTQMNAATRQGTEEQASLVCDAGVQEMLAWLQGELLAGRQPEEAVHFEGPFSARYRWRARLESFGGPRRYRLVSEALRPNLTEPVRRTAVGLEVAAPFTRWAWLADRVTGPLVATPGLFGGPVHVNGRVELLVPPGLYQESTVPVFMAGLSSSRFAGPDVGDGVIYEASGGGELPYERSGSPLPASYRALYLGGRSGLRPMARRVEFPNDCAIQAEAAWAGTPPTTEGVHLQWEPGAEGGRRLVAGVFVVGHVDSARLSLDGGGNGVISFTQGGRKTAIVPVTDGPIRAPSGATVGVGQTLVHGPSGETVYEGTPNGVVYCTGDIRSLRGINRGARTFAVDVKNGRQIVVSGDLLRADSKTGRVASGERDAFGLIADKIRVEDRPRVVIHAAICAGQGGLELLASRKPPGRLIVVGSLAEATSLPRGRLVEGVKVSGYGLELRYDPGLAIRPPPAYPTAPDHLVILSWREESLEP